MNRPLLVDAHVHIHPGWDTPRFLDAAAANFARAAAAAGLPQDVTGCLMLTEAGERNAFAELAAQQAVGRWSIRAGSDGCSLILQRAGSTRRLLVMAGQQVAVRGRLEVLALLTTARLPAGLDLATAVEATLEAGAIPVIPWGFGKWTFRRGGTVQAAMHMGRAPLFLGDNAGRPQAWPVPRLLRTGAATGLIILPGTDPLPFSSHEGRAGSYGFVAATDLSSDAPADDLRRWLTGLSEQPPVFGARTTLTAFVRDQVRMQLHSRRPR